MLPLDIQANYGNLELVIKEVNKIQDLSRQINYNGSVTVERFSKEIFEKIIEAHGSSEQKDIDDRKKEESGRKSSLKKGGVFINGRYYYFDEESNHQLYIYEIQGYKGNFVNILK